MKRSELNRYLREAVTLFKQHKVELPPWAFWTPRQWKSKGRDCDEIRKNRLGWDITDFGSGDFLKIGLLLFTVRNGNSKIKGGKPYAEKIMIAKPRQVTPIHFHWNKMEDIINRGGGDLVMRLWKSDKKEGLSAASFTVQVDGVTRRMKAGGLLRLKPGESITLEPFIYHTFWAENGTCLIGEVSMVNDDSTDNRFYTKVGRFPRIEEDAAPLYLLGGEYPA